MSNDFLDNTDTYQEEVTSFSPEHRRKLTSMINEGMATLQEIQTLTEGLNDTIKAVATDLNIKPSVLKKAIKVAHKAEFDRTRREHSLLETILEVTGKTL
jgi:hypothetical protein